MQPRQFTIWFIITWIALAIVYDLVVVWLFGSEATISHIIHDWAINNPVVAFALGVLCGHFFWSQTL